ncbi:hypothetical protein LAZ67_2007005 [Cordylochernes scorpioides]|uniref:Transposase n=1 Tax=Cordylochernes scorpioides TaxID=51811 RepID=A0ABY6K921_9ARAC|nr:hypothetical protein LAZ67_2007005 [Cordylochernes scorpioides]
MKSLRCLHTSLSQQQEWRDVMFTDESRFCLQHHDGHIRVWRYVEKAHSTSSHWPISGMMVWGAIGYRSRSPLGRQEFLSGLQTKEILLQFQNPMDIFKETA